MSYGLLIIISGGLTWVLSYATIQHLDFNLKHNVLILCATISALYAAGMVLMGETLIEDGVKALLVLVLTGIVSFNEPRFGFLLVCAIYAGACGMAFNTLSRILERRKRVAP